MMEFTAEMIAGFLGGDIVGDKETKVHTVSSIEEGKAGSLTYLTNPKYETFLYSTGASIVLVNRSFEPSQQVSATLIKVDDAAACVLKLLEMYNAAKPRRSGISKLASVAEKAEVGADCYIGDFTVVEAEAVQIGEGCQIYPQVYLGAGVTVGDRHDRSTPESRYTKAAGSAATASCTREPWSAPTVSASCPTPRAVSTKFRSWATW